MKALIYAALFLTVYVPAVIVIYSLMKAASDADDWMEKQTK